MKSVSILPRLGRHGRQLGLGAVLIAASVGAAQAQPRDYYLRTCSLFQFSASPVGGATPWVKTGLDTSTVDNVIATRTLSLSSEGTFVRRDDTGAKPKMLIGGRWSGGPPYAGALVPTNVKGLGIRVKKGSAVVKAERMDDFLTLYTARITSSLPPLVVVGNKEQYGTSIEIELVVIGDVAPGTHTVTGLDPGWSSTVFEAVTLQRPEALAPDVGAHLVAPLDDGPVPPGGGVQCYQRLEYDVSDMLTLEGGGPVIEATCTVDAKFTGAGFTLPMTTHRVSDFPNDGDVGRQVPFSVSVNSCAAGAKPRIAFNAQYGLVPGASGSVLQLKDAGHLGVAKNLGIILTRAGQSSALSIGDGPGTVGTRYDFDNIPASGVAANAMAEIALEARYKRVDQSGVRGVQPGAAISQVNFKIFYD